MAICATVATEPVAWPLVGDTSPELEAIWVASESKAQVPAVDETASAPQPTAAFVRGKGFLERLVLGDPEARADFVAEYTGLIRFAIAGVLRRRGLEVRKDEVEDLSQGIFVSLLDQDCRKLRMYEGRNQASLATFIRVCATRFVLDHIRHERHSPLTPDDAASGETPGRIDEAMDPRAGPEASVATAQEIARLRHAIDELVPRDQLLVRLHFVEGLEVAEVAKVLGLTENATYVLKSRVKKRLRAILGAGKEA
jgi:RNA polymerase sigma factor (sigma-70 family)